MSGAGVDRLGRRNWRGISRCAPAELREVGLGLAGLVGREEMIGGGIAKRIEEATAAMRVPPAFRMHSLGVVAHVEEIGPCLVVEVLGTRGPCDVRLAAVGKLELRTLAAVGTVNEQHAM